MSTIDHSPFFEAQADESVVLTEPLLNYSDKHLTLLIICFASFVSGFNFTSFMFTSDFIAQSYFQVSNNTSVSTIQFVGLLAVSYVTRPIGGYIISRHGDAYGRKPALLMAMTIFSITSLLIAILPTYMHIGSLAPLTLILLLLLQGGAFGAQIVLTWVYIAESLPPKNLSAYITMAFASAPLGAATCVSFLILLEQFMTHSEMVSHGWRLVFLLSAVISLLGLLLGRKLNETPLYKNFIGIRKNNINKKGKKHTFNRFNAVLKTTLLSLIITNLLTLIVVIMPKFIDLQFSIQSTMLRFANVASMVFLIFGMIFYSWLGRKISIGRALRLGAILLGIDAYAMFYYLSIGGGEYIVPIYASLGFCSGIVSLCIVIILKFFTVTSRLTSISVIFNSVAVFTGTTLPFFLLYIADFISVSPALYIILISILTFIVSLHTCHPMDNKPVESLV